MKNFLLFVLSLVLWLNSDFAYSKSADDKAVSPHFIINATQGTKVDFILAKQKIDAVIIGAIADVTVEQHYVNRGKGAIEGVYVFPASTRAAVYGMNMQIGKRLIIAQIKKKNDARQEYETAKKEGKRAVLLEQFEENVFKMNVANIMKGDTVITIMKYTENLDASNGINEFVYPTVVAPRYVSPVNKGKNDDEYGAIPYIDTKLIPDFNFEMNVVLNSGLNIDTIYCKSHKFDFNYSEINGIRYKADAKLNDSEFPANRDIILNFSFASQIYQTGLLVNEKDKYFMLTLQPPKRIEPISIINREYIFVMDVSGSMNGFPIDISKNIMKRIISGLDEDDLFNIVFFAGGSEMLFCMSQKADKMNKKFAEIFIDNQKGGGGTELLPALQKVIAIPKVKGYSRIIPILTDGEISISSETFNLIRNNIGDANIFSFGIGSSVNRDIIEGMARAGFGEKFIATNSEEGMKQGEQMLNMIDSPIVTDIMAEFNGWNVQNVTPAKIPDLFLNKPITIYGKYEGNLNGEIKISGQYGAERISVTMPLHKFAMSDSSNSIRYLVVRNRIAELNDLYNTVSSSGNQDSLEKIITDLCLQNNLLSKFTSFIAVDYEIVNKGGNSKKVNQINAVPKGMNKELINPDEEVLLRGYMDNIELRIDGIDISNQYTGGFGAGKSKNYTAVSNYASEGLEVSSGGYSAEYSSNSGSVTSERIARFAQDIPDEKMQLVKECAPVDEFYSRNFISENKIEGFAQNRIKILNDTIIDENLKEYIIRAINFTDLDETESLKLYLFPDIKNIKMKLMIPDSLIRFVNECSLTMKVLIDTNGNVIKMDFESQYYISYKRFLFQTILNHTFQKVMLNNKKCNYWIIGDMDIKLKDTVSIDYSNFRYYKSKYTQDSLIIINPKINYKELYKYIRIPSVVLKFHKDSIIRIRCAIASDSLLEVPNYSSLKSLVKRIRDSILYTQNHTPLIINGIVYSSNGLDCEINLNKCLSDTFAFNEDIFNLLLNYSMKPILQTKNTFQNHDTVKFRISIFDDDCNNYIYNKDMTYIIDTADPDGYFPFLFAGKGPGNFYEVEIPAADFLYKFPELELAKGKMVKVRVMIEE